MAVWEERTVGDSTYRVYERWVPRLMRCFDCGDAVEPAVLVRFGDHQWCCPACAPRRRIESPGWYVETPAPAHWSDEGFWEGLGYGLPR